MALLDRAIARVLPAVPRPVVRALAAPYIAGPELEDAVRVVRSLEAEGKLATIDVLGEEVSTEEQAREIARSYHRVLARIESEKLHASVSVKLSGLGLELGEELCRENLEAVVEDARVRGVFVRIDMEASAATDATLRLYRELRAGGRDNLGVVLQARLRRTIADADDGLDNVRLCKGIYLEPVDVAYQGAEAVRESYRATLRALLDRGGFVAIATHDEALIEDALGQVRERGLATDRYEFQMLLGVRPEHGDALVREGHPLRVYVPFGQQWYEYSVRRLQENPQIAGYVAADTLRRVAGRS